MCQAWCGERWGNGAARGRGAEGKETEDKVPVLLEITTEWGKQTVRINQVTYTLWNGL